MVISADEKFQDLQLIRLGPLTVTRGFSSFAFLPGREHEVVALKSEEYKEKISTYITVFDIFSQQVLLEEQLVDNEKFEGIEII